MSNYNQQNKFVKIDGEYVKLYVTTNSTLPKLLKNTGSLIVYHKATNDNQLYLGNELIAGGWGFSSKENQEALENNILPYWDKLFEFVTGYEDFWPSIASDDPLSSYEESMFDGSDDFTKHDDQHSLPWMLNTVLKSVLNKQDEIADKSLLKSSDISVTNESPYIIQTIDGTSRKIWFDMFPYMLAPVIYEKPEVKSSDIKVYYSYYSVKDNNSTFIYNDNGEIEFEAVYENGSYIIPYGAFVRRVIFEYVIDLKDTSSIDKMQFDGRYTQFNDLRKEYDYIQKSYTNMSDLVDKSISSLAYISNNDLSSLALLENANHFSNYVLTQTTNLSYDNTYTNAQYKKVYASYEYSRPNNNKYALTISDFTLVDNIKLHYKATSTSQLRIYPGLEKYASSLDTKFTDFFNNTITRDVMLKSYELALDDGYLDIDDEVKIKMAYPAVAKAVVGNVDNDDTKDIVKSLYTSNVFQDYTGYSYINDDKVEFVINDVTYEGISTQYVVICVGIPFKFKTNKVFAYISGKYNIEQKIDVTGLFNQVNNLRYFDTMSPIGDINYKYVTSDETNPFSQPYRLYIAIIGRSLFDSLMDDNYNGKLDKLGFEVYNSGESVSDDMNDMDANKISNSIYGGSNVSNCKTIYDLLVNWYDRMESTGIQYWSSHAYNYAVGEDMDTVDNILSSFNPNGYNIALNLLYKEGIDISKFRIGKIKQLNSLA